MDNRSGESKINNVNGKTYKTFFPVSLFDIKIKYDDDMVNLLVNAKTALDKLNSVASYVPDTNLFIFTYLQKEALLSSQIEGTRITLDEVLSKESENTNDFSEVVSHYNSIAEALNNGNSPITINFIKSIHKILMEENSSRLPGEFKQEQNFIGYGKNEDIYSADFIPCNPSDAKEAMNDLEKYINSETDLNALIKIALIHYQFETIHPFSDGNGRLGRLLITKLLCKEGLLEEPILYISLYLKTHRTEYYDRLKDVSLNGTFENWVKFFLKATQKAAESSLETALALSELRKTNLLKIESNSRYRNLREIYDFIEQKEPVITISLLSKEFNKPYPTAKRAVDKLLELGILAETQISGKSFFIYEDYVNFFRVGTELDDQ